VPRGYRRRGRRRRVDAVERFCERVADYRATVRRVGRGGSTARVARACRARGARRRRAAGRAGRIAGVELVRDDPPLGRASSTRSTAC
jgi:hypothetical protein